MKRELVRCGECEYLDRTDVRGGGGWCCLLPEWVFRDAHNGCYSGCKKEAERPFDGILRDHPLFEAKKNGD